MSKTKIISTPVTDQLQKIPSRRLLLAMNDRHFLARRREVPGVLRTVNPTANSFSLNEVLRAAEAGVDAVGPIGLTVSLKQVKILDAEAGGSIGVAEKSMS